MDPSIISTIESNGGRNNIAVVQMWALFDEGDYSSGKWGFFSPCETIFGSYTTSLYDPYGMHTDIIPFMLYLLDKLLAVSTT